MSIQILKKIVTRIKRQLNAQTGPERGDRPPDAVPSDVKVAFWAANRREFEQATDACVRCTETRLCSFH